MISKEDGCRRVADMKEITHEDYITFLKNNKEVLIEGHRVKLHGSWKIGRYAPKQDYMLEGTTVWSFPDRGDWATHIGDYRGNFSPFIPRNLILKYSNKGDWVLDQMVGSGTTLVECKLLQRNGIGVDINPDAIMVTLDRLNFTYNPLNSDYKEPILRTYVGDARKLSEIKDESIDLIVTHPPYAYIIPYSKKRIEGDISNLNLIEYLRAMRKIADESYRVLKENKYCGILIGDTRKQRHFIPIAFRVMQQFLDAGFVLKEDIIKLQHNVMSDRGRWRGRYYDFYKIMHEHIFVFRKPAKNEKTPKHSCKWW
ncbi:MAG: DNA methyltransferase [Nitrososphaerales archaeon]